MSAAAMRSIIVSFREHYIIERSDGEAFAAAASALRIGIVEDEPSGEVVLAPVHRRADQIEHRRAIDVESAASRFDLFVEGLFVADVIDRISEARAAAARRRQLDAD